VQVPTWHSDQAPSLIIHEKHDEVGIRPRYRGVGGHKP
jgi:hypothetical protein